MPSDAAVHSLQVAVQHQQAGRLPQAEAICRQIIAGQPENADALHMLGILALQTGQPDAAVEWIARAAALQPANAICQNNLGTALREKGKLDEAIACFKRAVELKPSFVPAQSNLGNALMDDGRPELALPCFERSVMLRPDLAIAHLELGNAFKALGRLDDSIARYRQAIKLAPGYFNGHFALGNALREKKQFDEAIACYRRAISLNAAVAEAHINLGSALFDKGRREEAIGAFEKALSIKPDNAQALFNLGNALREEGRFEEAVARYQQALALTPEHAEIHNNLGNVLALRGQEWMEDALASFNRAIELKPGFAEAHTNLGNALISLGRPDEAKQCFERALTLKADCADTHLMLGMVHLLQGQYGAGWEEYEWRWKNEKLQAASRQLGKPRWDGGDLGGRTLLIHAEQGLGDTFQFSRYIAMAVRCGGNVIFECQSSLRSLVQRSITGHTCIAKGEPLPPFDVHCPLLSLPRIFETTLENVPRDVPYLHADQANAKQWRDRLAAATDALKVGLVWAGNKDHKNDHNRSIALSKLAPLGELPGVAFFSLQKGEPAKQAQSAPAELHLIDWTDELETFDQTAGLIENLDLVISVDTAVAHLTGALGKRAWTLLPHSPDWRWMIAREDSPWYPTMRLFRQPGVGEWDRVIQRIADELALLAGSPQ